VSSLYQEGNSFSTFNTVTGIKCIGVGEIVDASSGIQAFALCEKACLPEQAKSTG